MTDKQLFILAMLAVDRGPRFDHELLRTGLITDDDPALKILELVGYIRTWHSYMAGTAYTITPLGRAALNEERSRRVEVAGRPMRVTWLARLWRRLWWWL